MSELERSETGLEALPDSQLARRVDNVANDIEHLSKLFPLIECASAYDVLKEAARRLRVQEKVER